MSSLPSSLDVFIDQAGTSAKTLLVVNRTEPVQFVELLERGVGNQPVDVVDRYFPEGVEDLVCLVDDGQVVATSPLSELENAYLLVNADRYRTGTRQIESGSFPDVLTGLDGIEFTLQGYPESSKEKLLLVLISRFIEFRALRHAEGALRTTFQHLSRLDDEYGTRTVYEWLAEADVATHVYGVNDDPEMADEVGVTVHAGDNEEYHHSWTVVFNPDGGGIDTADSAGTSDDDTAAGHAALVAVETGPNVWRGFWTYDPDRVRSVDEYLQRNF
jgi:hypothetical protein